MFHFSNTTYDEVNFTQQIQSVIKCKDTATFQVSSMLHKGNDSERIWQVIFSWRNSTGLQVKETGKLWLEVYKVTMVETKLRVVGIIEKPFSYTAKHYETKHQGIFCDHGIICSVPKVLNFALLLRYIPYAKARY